MKDHRREHDLRGPVRFARTEISRYDEGEDGGRWAERPWYGYAVEFDPGGRIVRYEHRNPDGSAWTTVSRYSADGRLLSTEHRDAQGVPAGGIAFDYDEQNRLVGEKVLGEAGMPAAEAVSYRYDETGRKTKRQTFARAGGGDEQASTMMVGIEGTDFSLTAPDAHRIETIYDERDDPVTISIYDHAGQLANTIEIRRDAAGRTLEEVQIIGEVPPFANARSLAAVATGGRGEEEESQGGQEEEGPAPPSEAELAAALAEMERMFGPGTEFVRRTHAYDEQGRVVEKKTVMAGMTAFHQRFRYNEHGDVVEETSLGQGVEAENRAVYEREYDGRGNWVVQKISGQAGGAGDLRPSVIYRRDISYY